MATNLFFNNFPKNITSEQLLIEDLVIEALKIYSMDIFYLPRTTRDSVDYLYGEDTLKQYVSAYPIEMYIENVTGMEGENDFISKFGLEIRDELQMLVSRRRFASSIPLPRPHEGDLIYIPLFQNFFEIIFVEHEDKQAMFYTLGRGRGGNVYVYALKLKQFIFSNEIIHTGIHEVDTQIRDNYSRVRFNLTNITGKFVNDEVIFQGSDYENRTSEAYVYSFTENPYIDSYRVTGEFSSGVITGKTSGATANVIIDSSNTIQDIIFEDLVDNTRIETESDNILDWSENNPFGQG